MFIHLPSPRAEPDHATLQLPARLPVVRRVCSGGARYDATMDGSNARVGTAIVFKDKAKLFAAAMEASNDKSLVAKSFVPHWEQEVSSHGRACVAFSMDACVPRGCWRPARARVCAGPCSSVCGAQFVGVLR